MDVLEIAPRLWRWTAYHEEWKEDVGCVYCETEDGVVLIDPLVPADDGKRFFGALDKEVHGQQVHVLVTVFWHVRSAAAMVERYGARVWGPKSGKAADRPTSGRRQRPVRARRSPARRARGVSHGKGGGGRLLDPAAFGPRPG